MLLIETEEGNGNEFNKLQTPPDIGTDYSDDSYEDNEYGNHYSDEEYDKPEWKYDRNKKDDLYEDDDPNEYDYYPNEVDTERLPKTELSASTCRPRRGIGNDVTLNVTCGDRVIIDCDLPRFGGCISRLVGCKII